MLEKNTCILLYTNYVDICQAIKKLQVENFNLSTVSIIGHVTDESNKSISCTPEIFCYELLGSGLLLELPVLGSLFAMGFIVELLINDKEGTDIQGQFNTLATTLFKIGVTEKSIRHYETEIESGKILLIINSKRDEVELSCEILHSEVQQATVHLA